MSKEPKSIVENQHRMFSAPPFIERWIRCLLGLTVGVGVGLAPYLGKYDVPLFDSLLKLIPTTLQDIVPIFSAAWLSLVAVVLQFYDQKRVDPAKLERAFKLTLVFAVVSIISLVVIHSSVVVKVPYLGGRQSETFLVGFNKPGKLPCTPEMSKAECVQHISLNVGKVEAYWGDRQIVIAKLALLLVYLVFTCSLGLLVGFLLIINPELDADENKSLEVASDERDGRNVQTRQGIAGPEPSSREVDVSEI